MTVLAGWLGAVAAVVGPISIIVGLPGALIGSIVGTVKVRRWVVHTFEPAQVATKAAADRATTAAGQATSAADQATSAVTSAAKHSQDAKASNAEVEKALIYLADELGRTRTALEETQRKRDVEAARNDEVFAALLRAKTGLAAQTGGLLVPFAAGDDEDPATVTGRHRLHTQHIQTTDEGDLS